MKVLIDTCVWSAALRRKGTDQGLTGRIGELVANGSVVMIGPIRQELLSGIADAAQFARLKETLSAFEDIPLESRHFIKAAEFSNVCRKKGVQGSSTDFLICAVASLERLSIFTSDKDFENYKKYVPIKLY